MCTPHTSTLEPRADQDVSDDCIAPEPAADGDINKQHSEKPVVIIGGAGYMGVHLASSLLTRKRRVIIYDCLATQAANAGIQWLIGRHGFTFGLITASLTDQQALKAALTDAEAVFYMAGQTSVHHSFAEPLADFEHNALNAVHVLHTLRQLQPPPPLLYVNTAKVYGALDDIELEEIETRYVPVEHSVRMFGLNEQHPLPFDTPFACSTGVAERYVVEFGSSLGLRTIVLRTGTVYGPNDLCAKANWVSQLMTNALNQTPIVVYGDGKQVRDLLFIDDAIRALLLSENHLPLLEGQVYNIGGGPDNAISLLEYLHHLRQWGYDPDVIYRPWQSGDQRYYVSDCRKFAALTGWKPLHGIDRGLNRLHEWLQNEPASHPDSSVDTEGDFNVDSGG